MGNSRDDTGMQDSASEAVHLKVPASRDDLILFGERKSFIPLRLMTACGQPHWSRYDWRTSYDRGHLRLLAACIRRPVCF